MKFGKYAEKNWLNFSSDPNIFYTSQTFQSVVSAAKLTAGFCIPLFSSRTDYFARLSLAVHLQHFIFTYFT